MGPVAVCAVAVVTRCTGAALGAHVTTAESPGTPGLANRELGQPALFLVPLDARKLRANERPMDGPLLDAIAVVAPKRPVPFLPPPVSTGMSADSLTAAPGVRARGRYGRAGWTARPAFVRWRPPRGARRPARADSPSRAFLPALLCRAPRAFPSCGDGGPCRPCRRARRRRSCSASA